MKHVLDLLIVIILLIAAGIGYLYLQSQNEDPDELATSGVVSPSESPALAASLPAMSLNALLALLPTSADLSAVAGAAPEPERYDTVMADEANEARAIWPEMAERMDSLSVLYGWDQLVGYRYDLCQQTSYPIGELNVQVDQLTSDDRARQYFSDPQVLGLLTAGDTVYGVSSTVHGWYLESSEDQGSCYGPQVVHTLMFEYWSLLFSLEFHAQQGTTRAEVQTLFDPLVALMVTRVNALDVASALPATPVPSKVLIEPAPIPFPFTLTMLSEFLPSDETFGEEGILFLNRNVSRSYTLDEYVAAFRNLNMIEVADALAQVGAETRMVGQVARVWDAQGACPNTMGIAFEFDFALFETPAGAIAYLNNPKLQAAWVNTGLITDYTRGERERLYVHGAYTDKTCGPVYLTEIRQPYGRVLAAISITHKPSVPRSEIENFLNTTMSDLGIAFEGLN